MLSTFDNSNKKYIYPLYLTIIWLICIVIVNPIGDFPLNDDWSYAYNAEALALENKIVFHRWGAMTLIVQTIWGALFCKIFGFSFTVLRASTLVLGWGTLLMSYCCFQEGGMKSKIAFWATLLFAFNTFFFANSFTYMTEVPFLFFFMSATLFFLKSINGKSDINILYAIIFSVLATLIRQIGVLLPIAFFFVYLIKNRFSLRTLVLSIIPSIATFSSLILFVNWRETHYGLSKNFGHTSQLLENFYNGRFVNALEHKSYGFFVFWGLFLLPLLIVLIPYFWKKYKLATKIVFIVITLLFCYPFIMLPHKDFMGNNFGNFGIGPFGLPTDNTFTPPKIGKTDWDNLYGIAFIAAIFLVKWIFIKTYQLFLFIKNKKSEDVNWTTLFALTTAFGYFVFLMLNNHYIDRYNLIAFPFLILLLVPPHFDFRNSILFKVIGFVSLIVIGVVSIGFTHDYLSWNRARWEAIDYGIHDLKIPKDQINGGFEYKGKNGIRYFVFTNWEDLEDWNTAKEQYKIAFSKQCKYNVVKAAPYPRYFPPRIDSMYLLQKEYLTQFDTIFCDVENLSEDGKYLFTNQKDIVIEANAKVSDKSFNGKQSLFLNKKDHYGFTFKLKNVEPCEKIWMSVWASPVQPVKRAVLFGEDGHYFPSDYRLTVNRGNGWGKSTQEFKVPPNFNENELTFYIYNGGGTEIRFDDLMIVRMK